MCKKPKRTNHIESTERSLLLKEKNIFLKKNFLLIKVRNLTESLSTVPLNISLYFSSFSAAEYMYAHIDTRV